MKTITLTLPSNWAPYLINHDKSYFDSAGTEYASLVATLQEHGVRAIDCLTCSETEEYWAMHDASDSGVPAAMCLEFIFKAREPEPSAKTLTYGTLPSFEEFKSALIAYNPLVPIYHINLNASDGDILDLVLDSCHMSSHEAYGKVTCRLDATQLYELCEALCQEADRPGEISAEGEDSWAGTFCSDILSTLGFTWT